MLKLFNKSRNANNQKQSRHEFRDKCGALGIKALQTIYEAVSTDREIMLQHKETKQDEYQY